VAHCDQREIIDAFSGNDTNLIVRTISINICASIMKVKLNGIKFETIGLAFIEFWDVWIAVFAKSRVDPHPA
jgi:hypothetical protein